MRSKEHLLVSVPVTGVALAAVRERCSRFGLAALGVYGVLLGVFVDLDHFLIARLWTGDWHHLRGSVRNPIGAFVAQEEIFDDVRDMQDERLLSHVLLAGLLVGVTRLLSRPLGFVTGVVLYAHLLCDLLRDNEVV